MLRVYSTLFFLFQQNFSQIQLGNCKSYPPPSCKIFQAFQCLWLDVFPYREAFIRKNRNSLVVYLSGKWNVTNATIIYYLLFQLHNLTGIFKLLQVFCYVKLRKSVPVGYALFTSTAPVRYTLFTGIVPVRYALFTSTVPERYALFTGTVPVNNFFRFGKPYRVLHMAEI